MPKPLPPKPKTIGIVGSRRRDDDKDFRRCQQVFMEHYLPGDRIVSGGCKKGGDLFAEIIARSMGLTIIIHHANWKGPENKSAGFSRNSLIADDCDILIAVVADDRTGGTEDTIHKAEILGKKVFLA